MKTFASPELQRLYTRACEQRTDAAIFEVTERAWALGFCSREPSAAQGLVLRRATVEDSDRLLEWRNDPDTRAASVATEPISPCRHEQWLEASLKAAARRLYIAELAGVPIGTGRIDIVPSFRAGERGLERTQAAEVSLTVARRHRGRGHGHTLLAALIDTVRAEGLDAVQALVKVDNARSLVLFITAGFIPTDVTGQYVSVYRRL